MEIAGYGGHKGYTRLALGAAPMLLAWGTLTMDPTMALVSQWAGFTTLWYADSKATTAGWSKLFHSEFQGRVNGLTIWNVQLRNGTHSIVSTYLFLSVLGMLILSLLFLRMPPPLVLPTLMIT